MNIYNKDLEAEAEGLDATPPADAQSRRGAKVQRATLRLCFLLEVPLRGLPFQMNIYEHR